MNIQRNAPIGVIDSGIGGLSLLKLLVDKYSNENYIYLADNLNMPYGNKSKKWLVNRICELITYLYDNFNVKLVILACNTASSCLTAISKNSPVKVIGLDLNSCIVDDYKILCTRLTAKNNPNLNTYTCSRLARFIEQNLFNKNLIKKRLKHLLNNAKISENNIVLGCTHYELIVSEFTTLLPNKNIILPCNKFVESLKLDRNDLSTQRGDILMLSTLSTKSYIDTLWRIFKS